MVPWFQPILVKNESRFVSTRMCSRGFGKHANTAGGGNYQTMINEALRAYVENRTANLEQTIRRVIREELRARKKGAA